MSVAGHVESHVLTCSRTGAAKRMQVLRAVYQAASVLQVWHRMTRASVCQSACAHVFMLELSISQDALCKSTAIPGMEKIEHFM